MKAICKSSGYYKGLIKDEKMLDEYLDGKIDWKPHVKRKMESVEIPFTAFEYFVELHKEELARQTPKEKEKENGGENA